MIFSTNNDQWNGGPSIMGFFDFFKLPDINQGIAEYRAVSGAVLLDVRTPEEYHTGHIPGSKNIPLQTIGRAASVIRQKNTPLYVYCQSGARSRQAVKQLQQDGYTSVTNIGGMAAYSGKVEY